MGKLKEKRLETGLSQSQLAEKAGLNVRTLQHYEQGSKIFDNARIDTILKVCNTLECRFEEIIENEEYIHLFNEYMKKLLKEQGPDFIKLTPDEKREFDEIQKENII